MSAPIHPSPPPTSGEAWSLLRLGAWSAAVCAVLGSLVQVRLEVQDLRERLARSHRELEAAETLRDRLAVELDARQRAVAMEGAATELGLGLPPAVVDLSEPSLMAEVR